jgi:hypothetical protein
MDGAAGLPASLEQLAARYGSAAPAVLEQLGRTHECSAPIRLVGERITTDRETGEILARYGSDQEPSGFVLLPCGNRRASRCPACSKVYRGDAFALIRAGLAGDEAKGVSADLAGHPRVFATFTAPSFGPVHRRVVRGGVALPCREIRREQMCQHSVSASCSVVHDEDDRAIGQALCPHCFDYVGAVLWNAHMPLLWRRTVISLPRVLAAYTGRSERAVRSATRISFAKVAEFQRRGLVHLHVIFRLDGPDPESIAPPTWATSELLAQIVAETMVRTSVLIGPEGGRRSISWGSQFDIRSIRPGGEGHGSDGVVAGYVAKYATKAAEDAGGLDRRIRSAHEIDRLPLTDHARRLMATCWTLAAIPEFEHLRLREWAHMLGFRGHFLTKARRYSVTFGELRAARMRYRAELAAVARGDRSIPDDGSAVAVGNFEFAGVGLVGPDKAAPMPSPATVP